MAGPYLFVADPTGSRYTHFTFDSSGQELSSESGKRRSDQYAWSETNQKMYFFNDDNNGDRLMSEDIDEFGIISDDEDESPGTNSSDIDYPIRVAPDGSFVLLGSGRIFDALSLQIVDSLPNDLADAQWLSDRSIAAVGIVSGNLFVQEYDASYQLQSEIRLTSDFANVVADDDTLYLVWEKDGIPQFSPWNFGSADFDEDGTDNEEDAFPFDPTESADNDQDGTGDNADTDDDNDGVPDVDDAFPRNAGLPPQAPIGRSNLP
jgi:hypothetical protein